MRILHISDLHIKRIAGKLDNAERCCGHLCEQVEKIHQERPIGFIFITGDLVDKGGASFDSISDGFNVVNELLVEPLLKITSLPVSRVLFAPGNHDVEGCKIPKDFDTKNPMHSESDVNWIFEKILEGNDLGKEAISRLEAYNEYENRFASAELKENEKYVTPLAKHYLYDIENRTVGISCLCSPWRCDEHGETDNLVLGLQQMNEADTLMKKVDCRIGLIHHDPSLITDWEKTNVRNVILSKYDIIFLGHTHISENITHKNEIGSTAFCCSSGIITSNVGDANYKNGFEVVDVDIDNRSLEIRKYEHKEDETFCQDMNFGPGGFSTLKFGEIRHVLPLSSLLSKSEVHSSSLISSEKFSILKNLILDQNTQFLLIGAFSGLGKTRLIYEVALEINNSHKDINEGILFYYCENAINTERINNEINDIVLSNKDSKVVLILDNIEYDFFRTLTNTFRHSSQLRIIGLTNKVLDIDEETPNYTTITPDDMKEAVNAYIDSNISNRGDHLSAKNNIKQFSHGFPMLAIALVDKFNKGEEISVHDADELVGICWNDHGERDPNEAQLLKLIALFQPFPAGDDIFEVILGHESFSSLSKLSRIEKLRLRNMTQKHYGKTILEVTDGGMTVRPYPLAMHLAKQWLKENGDQAILQELGNYIKTLEDGKANLIVECMASRLRKMDDDPIAVELVAELTGENGFFGREDVVCSELGSRLILAMSTVNPLAVVNALYRIFHPQNAIKLRNLLSPKVRSNILCALHHILFDGPSFEKGIEIMGKLGLAETESYGNNSINTFTDSFHILLPGTELNLLERLRIIRNLAESDSELHQLTPFAIKGALSYGHFMRTGGNEFGSRHKSDYHPTNQEVIEYWDGVQTICLNLIKKGEFLDEIGGVIKSNLFVWAAKGVVRFLMPLLELYGQKAGLTIDLSEKDWLHFIGNVERSLIRYPEIIEQSKALHPLYVQENFITELEAVTFNFHLKIRPSNERYFEEAKEYYKDITNKFVQNQFYSNSEVLKGLLVDKDMNAIYFAPALEATISDNQLTELFTSIYNIIDSFPEYEESAFLAYLISSCKGRSPLDNFLEKLYVSKKYTLYINSIARSEDSNAENLNLLKTRFSPKDFLPLYLDKVNVYFCETFLNSLFEFLLENVHECWDATISFLIRNRFWFRELSTHLWDVITKILEETDISKLSNFKGYDFWEFSTEVLKVRHNSELAKKLNIMALGMMTDINYDANVGDFYELLLDQYIDEVWPDFAAALFGENVLLYWRISNAVRCGSLTSDMVFKVPNKYLKEALDKYPERAPVVLACLCQLYRTTSEGTRFAEWPQYLIDNYGARNEVLEQISCNMGSFSWVGSIIPLYRRQIEVLSPLTEHSIESVRTWADRQIEVLEKEIKREKAKEDFERLHYGV